MRVSFTDNKSDNDQSSFRLCNFLKNETMKSKTTGKWKLTFCVVVQDFGLYVEVAFFRLLSTLLRPSMMILPLLETEKLIADFRQRRLMTELLE